MVFPENEQGRREKSDLRRSQWSVGRQQRWVYLFKTGLISKEQADTWAEEVRPSNQDEVEIEGDEAITGRPDHGHARVSRRLQQPASCSQHGPGIPLAEI
jgi:hypothetical protein